MHTCIGMTRVISLSDEAYEKLKSEKEGKESFSDVVNKLTSEKKKVSIMDFAGKWPGGKEELDRIEKIIYEDRKKFKLRKVEF